VEGGRGGRCVETEARPESRGKNDGVYYNVDKPAHARMCAEWRSEGVGTRKRDEGFIWGTCREDILRSFRSKNSGNCISPGSRTDGDEVVSLPVRDSLATKL
jgi:hypothetical protein